MRRCLYTQCLSTSLALIAPITTTIATILAYTLFGHNLTAVQAFTLVMVNYVAAHGIRMMPICLRDIVAGRIALKRLEVLLRADERINYLSTPLNAGNAIEFRKATLARDAHRDVFATLNRRAPGERAINLMGDVASKCDNVPRIIRHHSRNTSRQPGGHHRHDWRRQELFPASPAWAAASN